eukprot:495139-Rhodomonas_salina.1
MQCVETVMDLRKRGQAMYPAGVLALVISRMRRCEISRPAKTTAVFELFLWGWSPQSKRKHPASHVEGSLSTICWKSEIWTSRRFVSVHEQQNTHPLRVIWIVVCSCQRWPRLNDKRSLAVRLCLHLCLITRSASPCESGVETALSHKEGEEKREGEEEDGFESIRDGKRSWRQTRDAKRGAQLLEPEIRCQ